jgi:hypothetical protein
MSTATNVQAPRKRTRISDDVEVIDTTTSLKKHEFNLYTGSLASLQPVIRPIADIYFIRLTDLFNKYVADKVKLQKFDDTNFIPKSCRVNFMAGASNLVKGSTEYSELLAQIDNKNRETASHHRDTVKKVIQLEIKASQTTLRDTFCECLYKLSTMFMSFHFYKKAIPEGQIHKLSKDIVSNEPRIIHFIFEDDTDSFRTWYNKKFNITLTMVDENNVTITTPNQQPAAAAAQPASSNPDSIILSLLPNGSRDIADYNLSELEEGQYEFAEFDTPGSGLDTVLANRRMLHSQASTASLNDQPFSRTQPSQASTVSLNDIPFSRSQASQTSTVTVNARQSGNTQPTPTVPHYILPAMQRNQYSLLMLQMTFHSWTSKIHLHEEKLKNAELAKLATTLLTSDVTNDVAMTIAAQPPASEAIINDLINSKFEELKKTLVKGNIPTHKGTTSTSKNSKRGKPAARASTTKKSKKAPTKPAPAKTAPTKKPPRTPSGKRTNQPRTPPSNKSASSNNNSNNRNPRRPPRKSRGAQEPDSTKGKSSDNRQQPRVASKPRKNNPSTPRRPSGQRKNTKNAQSNANSKR